MSEARDRFLRDVAAHRSIAVELRADKEAR